MWKETEIFERVRRKKEDYRLYNFERLQEEAFATFFDLAQEYTALDNLYQICVAVPKVFFGLESRLFVIGSERNRLEKVCTSEHGLVAGNNRYSITLQEVNESYQTKDSWIFPIRGNLALTQWIPFQGQSRVLGLFEIFPKEKVDAKSHFFLEKFTNRIGYNLHQKLLIEQNLSHLKFINQLVSDIEHNVVSPNLYYKLFIVRLRKCLDIYAQIQKQLEQMMSVPEEEGLSQAAAEELAAVHSTLEANNRILQREREALTKHYEHTSLFLETLLRRDHFVKGTYVLRKQPCNFRAEIIDPLLDRYLPVFQLRNIQVEDRLEGIPDEEVTLFVDKGLISQVFDNLLGNAVKYTQEIDDRLGRKKKMVSYGRTILEDYFDEGIHGVRFDFFSSGPPLPPEEAQRVFEEGFRASNAGAESGSGHGLHFVRNVVEIHGGQVGCQPEPHGNRFYFILPMKQESPAAA